MKTLFKKKVWISEITTLCFFVVTLFVVSDCDLSETSRLDKNGTKITKGVIVGYTKCHIERNGEFVDEVFGLFIITEKKDSLLTFNVSPSSININPDLLGYGFWNFSGGSIDFSYRIAKGEEIKQMTDFWCPQNDMMPGFAGGPPEKYTQIVVTNIKNNIYENHNISACGIKDPLQNINWLKTYCDSLKVTQRFSSVHIDMYKIIDTEDNVFKIGTSYSNFDYSPFLYTVSWHNCTGELIFGMSSGTPPAPGIVEDFMADKELVAELYHFVKQ